MAAPSPGWRSQQDVPLPRALDTNKFADARQPEVIAITEALKKSKLGTQYGVDGIPRHLRRRTRGHNSYKHRKRPNLMKEIITLFEKEIGVDPEPATTDPTSHLLISNRKMRRRPAILAADCLSKASWSQAEIENYKEMIDYDELGSDESLPPYEPPPPPPPPRRLETHLWHAKRLSMVSTWNGWVLSEGESGRGRGTRAFARRISTGAVIHDASYWCPVLLSGPLTEVISCLNLVIDPEIVNELTTHLEKGSSKIIGCEFEAMLHKAALFPLRALAPVKILALPGSTKELVKLCIWIHGGVVKEAFDALKSAVARTKAVAMDVEDTTTTTLDSRRLLSLSVGDARRIEIRGGNSDQALLHALFSHNKSTKDNTKPCLPQKLSSLRPHQAAFIALADPRLSKPITLGSSTCTSLLDTNSSNKVDFDVFRHNYPSPLTETAISQARKEAREQLVVAGETTTTPLEALLSSSLQGCSTHCGAIVIRGYKASKSSTGWSIILPPGWVMPIWVALAFQGCRAVGQREWRWLHTLDRRAFFPYDVPDTLLHVTYMRELDDKARKDGLKRPIGMYKKSFYAPNWHFDVDELNEKPINWRKKSNVFVARSESSMLQSLFGFSPSPSLPSVGAAATASAAAAAPGLCSGTSLRPVAKALAAKKLQWVPRKSPEDLISNKNLCLVETAVNLINQGTIDEGATIYVIKNEEAVPSQGQTCHRIDVGTLVPEESDKKYIQYMNLVRIGHITSPAPQGTGRGTASMGVVSAAAFWRLRSLQYSEYRRDEGTVEAWVSKPWSPLIFPVRLALLVERK